MILYTMILRCHILYIWWYDIIYYEIIFDKTTFNKTLTESTLFADNLGTSCAAKNTKNIEKIFKLYMEKL